MKNKEGVLDFLDITVYLLLSLIFIYRGFKTTGNIVTKVMFFVLGFVFLAIGILFQWQKVNYKKALNALNDEINVDKACFLYNKITKYDFLKTYTKQRGFFDLMVMLELSEMQKVKWIVEMNEKHFNSNDEMKMIKYYYLMRADLVLGNNDEVLKSYNELNKILETGASSTFFTNDEAKAIKNLAQNRYADAFNCFEKIDLNKLCAKDQKWVLTNLANLASGNAKKEYKKKLNELLETKKIDK